MDRKGVQFGKIDFERLSEIAQAAHALRSGLGLHTGLHQQTLCCAGDAYGAIQVFQVKIGRQADGRDVKWKIPEITHRLMDNKPDIEPEEVA